jgi:deoxyribodipyrimidine photo-lyase
MINRKRVRNLKNGLRKEGHILYWMSRDQRVFDNWALIHAIESAEDEDQSVIVAFSLAGEFLNGSWRCYDFMLKGLKKTEELLSRLNIPFFLVMGKPEETIPAFVRQHRITLMVTDFDPLQIKREWKQKVIDQLNIPVDEVDAHNIVPCWLASDKAEFSAATLRTKLTRWLPEFLDEFPPIVRQRGTFIQQRVNWEAASSTIKADRSVRPADWISPGEAAATATLQKFLGEKIDHYALHRNDPNLQAGSGLSPYLHYGQISSQRIALEITSRLERDKNADAFLEELIVRSELADNFCFYNPDYDSVDGFPKWAKKTLEEHGKDEREFIYDENALEQAKTHDPLWNAAQKQMVTRGFMHGYMRMYWAKKILEWTPDAESALRIAIYLNDKYSLDGRDPNGYTGIAWSIGGVHDRAWAERPVYGKIRYMNYAGCERKFDVKKFIRDQEKREDGMYNVKC